MLYKFAICVVKFLLFFVIRIRREGVENIPKEGAVIIAYNHRSNLDPVVGAITCPRQLSFMAKSELFKNKLFGGLIKRLGAFPVNRGKGDISAVKTALNIFKQNGAMLIFPEGGRIKDGKRKKAKSGVAVIARMGGVKVIPAHIKGDYKWMHKITVVYGEPIDFEQYKSQKLTGDELQEMADGVMDTIYAL